VYSGRFAPIAAHGQTFESHPGKAGGLPFFGYEAYLKKIKNNDAG
jgi:hypothetical protein